LPAERVRLVQFALLGEGEEFIVGQRTPEEIRKPAGEGEVVEPAGLLPQEEEVRGNRTAL